MIRFDDSVIWVTGASGALGSGVVRYLLDNGAQVVGSSRGMRDDPAAHPAFMPLRLDVTRQMDVDAAAALVHRRFGRIDGLVTCTAAAAFGDFLSLPDSAWADVIDTKLMGTVRVVRTVLPFMVAQRAGSIVLMSGRGGLTPPPNHLPGASVNAALILLAQGLATQYGPDGIRVNAVSPGPIASDRLDAMRGVGASASSALGRPGMPRDVAHAVAFLLSSLASHITGGNTVVDGGRLR